MKKIYNSFVNYIYRLNDKEIEEYTVKDTVVVVVFIFTCALLVCGFIYNVI